MTSLRGLLALGVIAMAVACGGGESSDEEPTITTTAPPPLELTVHFLAEQRGIGCVASRVHIGTQLVVEDPAGVTIGTGTFELSPGLTPGVDICDFTAVTAAIDRVDFFTLVADGAELITVSLDEVGNGSITLAEELGDIQLVP